MARIVLEHPDLDGTIERDERSLAAWEAKGWHPAGAAPTAEPEPEPEPKSKPRDRKADPES